MSISLKIVLVVILLIYWFFIIKSVRNKSMRIGYLIFWLIIGIAMIIALIIPNCVETISRLIGFELPINMIFSFAILVILYLLYDITKQLTKEQNKNTMLIQEISIMKKRIEELEKKEK
ncbi:MAG: DUF2304 domain-containing protein [Clostridia bacterium]|nr:DUF2304 domain-containing protein [Clostridia bacterium]